MADDIQKKVLIDVQIADEDANSALQDLKTKIDALNGAVINSKVTMSDAKAATAALTAELAKGKIEQQNVKTAIDKARLAQLEANIATKEAKKNMVVASGSYAEAQQKLTALAKAIKNTEGGFKSQDAAIKAQIADYNKLNSQLKTFDAQMGNHQRNVGNYGKALESVTSQLDRLIPGFSQLQGVLKSASEGFSAMGSGATEAGEAGVGAEVAIEGAAVAAGVAIAAVAAAIVAEGTYLLQFQKYADGLSKTWEGLKAGARGAMGAINGVGEESKKTSGVMVDMATSFAVAFGEAHEAQGRFIDANRQIKIDAVEAQEENAKIRKDMLIIMNLKTNEVDFQKAYNEAHSLTLKQYNTEYESQEKLHKAIVDRALAGNAIDKETAQKLKDVKGGYMAILEVAKNITATDKVQAAFLDEMVESAKKGVEIQGHYDTVEQLEKNKAERKQSRLDKAEAAAITAQQKEADSIAKIKEETERANSEHIASISRMLGFKREAFAKELSDADEHYRQLIFKQREFIAKMEVIVNSKKSTPKEKAAAFGAIGAAKDDITAINNEHYAEQEHALQEHSKRMLIETQRAANELAHAQISSISDAEEKEKQSLNLAYRERIQTLNTQANEIAENEAKLANEINDKIKPPTAERLAILKAELAHEKSLYAKNRDEATEATEEFQQKQTDSLKKYISERKILTDQLATISAARKKGFGGGSDNPFNKDLENAQVAEAQDNTQSELQNAGLDGDKNKDGSEFSKTQLLQKQKIAQQGEDVVTKIKKDATKKRTDMEVDAAKQVADTSFQIIQQSMERSFQNQQVMLNRAKDHDLQNQALTSTQKYAIQEKYRKKEGALKVKQFKQEQELALVKGVIDTASAVIKASPNPVLMALAAITGAIEIGVIASQKAPAYAKGGIHYDSDGKGGVLPGYSRTDNMNARLRSGEGIVVSEAMRDPWAKSVVSAINQSYGGRSFDSTAPVNWSVPGFASGGVYKNYLPTGDNGLRPQINVSSGGRMHPDDITGIANAVSRLPAPLMDIKDVNFAQNKLASAVDRLNY